MEEKKQLKTENEDGKERVTKKDTSPQGNSWKVILISCLINIVITLFILHVYVEKRIPNIAVVDLSGYLVGLRNLYLQGKINQEEAKRKLDEAIAIIQNEGKNKIILSAEVVLGKNNKVKMVQLPQLPQEAYQFDLKKALQELRLQSQNEKAREK